MPSFESFMFGLIYGMLLLGIASMTVAIIVLQWKAWAVRRWATTTGLVLVSKVVDEGPDGSCYPTVTYRYQVGGRIYESSHIAVAIGGRNVGFGYKKAERITARFPVGTQIPVYYDPKNPVRSVLMHGDGNTSLWLLVGIFALLVMFGILYGVRWVTSHV